jgi:uncharacterized protein (DUF2267 family)
MNAHLSGALGSAGLVERVMGAGIPDRRRAEKALRATLAVMGERMTRDEADALGRVLSPELQTIVHESEYDSDFDAAEFYERIRRRLQSFQPGTAHEDADVVLRSIGDFLDDELRGRLRRALPEAVAARMTRESFGPPPPHPDARHAPPLTTLSAGHPGSRHPLSEAAPPVGHTHSVARSDDPHGETKLSSSRGSTQERLGDSLARGRPPAPERPVAEAKDQTRR